MSERAPEQRETISSPELRGSTVDDSAPSAGSLGERYRIQEELARGGMGVVYRARDVQSGRKVALKLIQASNLDAMHRERFRREGVASAQLSHPNVVDILDAGVDGETPYLVHELVSGARPLDAVFRERDLRGRVTLVRDAARGLGHAHERGIVHRDVKPDNLLVDAEGHVRVADFGVALISEQARLTRSDALVGTPQFMAPEQIFAQREIVGPPTDVWSLGVILYLALHDELPFAGRTLHELMGQIARSSLPRLAHPTPLERRVEAVCHLALSRDPSLRPAGGDALAEALDDALAEGRPAVDRHGAAWMVIATGGVAALALAVVGALGRSQAPAAKAPPAEIPANIGANLDSARPVDSSSAPLLATRTFRSSKGPTCAAFASDTTAITLGTDWVLRRWDLVSGELQGEDRIGSMPRPLLPVRSLLLVGDEVVANTDSSLLRVSPGGAEHLLHASRASSVEPGPGGTFLFGAGGSPVQQFGAGVARAVYPGPAGSWPIAYAASPEGARVVVVFGQHMMAGQLEAGRLLRVFDAESGAQLGESTLPIWVRCAAWARDGRSLWVGTTVAQIFQIDLKGAVLEELIDPSGPAGALLLPSALRGSVHRVLLSRDGSRLFALSRGTEPGKNQIGFWDLSRPKITARPTLVREARTVSLALSPSGRNLLVGYFNGDVEVLSAE